MKRIFIAIALLFTVHLLHSQQMDELHLQEITVSSSRWSERNELLPVKISHIEFEEANQYNPQTAADLLGLSGEVFIQKSQYGGGSPMIRGFATNRLLYSIDGVRMNNAIFRSGNLQNVISLDPFAIGRTEVLFGPGAVSYGSDAIGGAMVFNTLQARLSDSNEKPLFCGSATVRTATASDEITGHIHFGVGLKKWAFLTSLTYSDYKDLKQGMFGPEEYIMPYVVIPEYSHEGVSDCVTLNNDPRKQSPSGYSQLNFMQKVRYSVNDDWNIEYAFHLSGTSEYARYDRHQRMRNDLPRYAEWNYGPQKWMMNHIKVDNSSENMLYDSLRLNVALQNFAESRISRDFNKPNRETQSEKVDAYSVNLDFRKALADNMQLFYGAEYVQNNVRSTAFGTDVTTGETTKIASRYPKSEWYSAGIYSQFEWQLNSWVNIAAGLRYNHYIIDSDFSTAGYAVPFDNIQHSNKGSISGNIGVNWRPSNSWLVRANYARGFRAPNVDDMGKLFDSADGCVTVPNPMLEPEYADNIEAGVVKHFGRYLKIDFTAYYTHLSNAIVRRDYTFLGNEYMQYGGEECRVQALQNAAVANVCGVQAGVESRFAKWFYAAANVNWQYGREELDNGEVSPSRHAAPLFGRAAVGFSNSRLSAEIFTQFQAERKADEMPEEEKDKKEFYAKDERGNVYSPGWITLNARLSYRIMDGFYLNTTLENILDKRYRPYSCGISAPGRNFTLSLTYTL